MIRSIKELQGYSVHATDGDIGKVEDFYFDDDAWTVRYLVVNTGNWLTGRSVLIAPASFQTADYEQHRIDLSLSQDQIKNSPDIDTHMPVSRQKEEELSRYYGWTMYWAGDRIWGAGLVPGAFPTVPPAGAANQAPIETNLAPQSERSSAEAGDTHLRSAHEVLGYHIQARDGEIGHVADFLADDQSWRIDYMVVDTSNWLSGREVVVPPTFVKEVDWAKKHMVVDLKRETIQNSPEFNPETMVNRA